MLWASILEDDRALDQNGETILIIDPDLDPSHVIDREIDATVIGVDGWDTFDNSVMHRRKLFEDIKNFWLVTMRAEVHHMSVAQSER